MVLRRGPLTAQIAIRQDACEIAVRIDHTDTAKTLGGHFDQRFRHDGFQAHHRELDTPVHDVAHLEQSAAQLAAGVQYVKIIP